MAEAHSGSAALESDKAGDGVPGYSSTTAYQGDFTQFFYLFCEKGKKPYTAVSLVCIRHCDTQLGSTPDMELGIAGSCELGSFWARQENCSLPSTAETVALHSF